LIRHNKGTVAFELYDHQSGNGETSNIAAKNHTIVKELNELIDATIK